MSTPPPVPRPRVPSPGTVYGSPYGPTVAGSLAAIRTQASQQTYRPRMKSPLLPALLFLASMPVAIWLWILLVQQIAYRSDTFKEFADQLTGAFWIGILMWHVVYALFVWWLDRIGHNERTFGGGLVLAATYPYGVIFWSFCGAIIPGAGPVFAFLLALTQYGILLWPWRRLITLVWDATDFAPILSLLGWLPAAIGLPLSLAAVQLESRALVVVFYLLGITQFLFVLVALITATVVQHGKCVRNNQLLAAAAVGQPMSQPYPQTPPPGW